MNRGERSSGRSVNIHSTHALLARSETEVGASSFSEHYNKHEGNEYSDRRRCSHTDVLVKILLFTSEMGLKATGSYVSVSFVVSCTDNWIPPAPFLKRSEHKQAHSIFFFLHAAHGVRHQILLDRTFPG